MAAQTNCSDHQAERLSTTVNWILARIAIKPKVGIICGSGLASLCHAVANPVSFDYEDIPNFPKSTVSGHEGKLIIGTLSGVPVMCMQGRFHFFEGYSPKVCAMPVRVMKMCGIDHLIVSNAAGGINRDFREGDLMIIKDHINFLGLAGHNPLVGPNDESFGPRFPSLNDMYNYELRKKAKEFASQIGLRVKEGVYSAVAGPMYETVAEVRMLERLGVDAAGMSTVHEVIMARHADVTVFGFSVITNECTHTYIDDGSSGFHPDHADILNVAKSSENGVNQWISMIVQFIGRSEDK